MRVTIWLENEVLFVTLKIDTNYLGSHELCRIEGYHQVHLNLKRRADFFTGKWANLRVTMPALNFA